ncbi:Pentatricopeptide repeat-containing protein [Camellia lanceoleosa]|uniref:Pentatricopeptide repeat-containing protein n=1 Tax=Camellia lanceoleosa TaxID=1840588 RepID=A0ACC0IRJ4_9ERIC|nr:Pentatricopeptide repeat-containing protein [Camellia lanceoleosa]
MANHANRLIISRLTPTTTSRCYSTPTALTVTKGKEDSLFRKLSALGSGGSGPDAAVPDTLDEWVKQGKSIKRFDIISCVNHLRKFKKYHHAIQLYEWMEKGKNKMNNADCVIR